MIGYRRSTGEWSRQRYRISQVHVAASCGFKCLWWYSLKLSRTEGASILRINHDAARKTRKKKNSNVKNSPIWVNSFAFFRRIETLSSYLGYVELRHYVIESDSSFKAKTKLRKNHYLHFNATSSALLKGSIIVIRTEDFSDNRYTLHWLSIQVLSQRCDELFTSRT